MLQGASSIADPLLGGVARVIPGGDLATSMRLPLIDYGIDGGTLDSNFWTTAAAGTGAATQSSGLVTLATGTTLNSTVSITSKRNGRYLAGTAQGFIGEVQIPEASLGVANNARRWGDFTSTDGYYWQLNGTTLQVVSRSGSVDTAVSQSSWNGPGQAFVLDTNFHRFEVVYWGNSAAFIVDGLLAHILPGNSVSSVRTQALNLPLRYENNNSGGSTTNVQMNVRASSQMRFGPESTQPAYQHFNTTGTTTIKTGMGRLWRIVINTLGGSGLTCTVFDNTAGSGTTIAVLALTSSIGSFEYNTVFQTGLTVTLAGTIGSGDITVVYD